MQKNGQFWRVFENLKHIVTRQVSFKWDKNWWKTPKLKNSNATFWVIFKHCGLGQIIKYVEARAT